jgi:hypothetical protein
MEQKSAAKIINRSGSRFTFGMKIQSKKCKNCAQKFEDKSNFYSFE